MLQGWRPLDPLINSPRDPRRENPVSADLEHPRPLPDPEKQCKTIGQAQPYRLPFPERRRLRPQMRTRKHVLAAPHVRSRPGPDLRVFGFSHNMHSLLEKPGNSDGLIKAALGTPASPPMVARPCPLSLTGMPTKPVTICHPGQTESARRSASFRRPRRRRLGSVGGPPRSISLMPVLAGPPQTSNLGPGRRGIPD